MDSLHQDFRFAMRSLGRRPGLVAAVTLTLALGIGANTAVFSLVDAVLLRPLPVQRPGELVAVQQAYTGRAARAGVPFPLYQTLDQGNGVFSGLAGYYTLTITVRSRTWVDQVQVAAVTGDYFGVLGLRPTVGRLLSPEDDTAPGANPVAVISDALWETRFARSPDAVGTSLHAGNMTYTIVGVAPSDFRGVELASSPEVWVPITMITSLGDGGLFSGPMAKQVWTTTAFGWVYMVGRLRPQVDPAIVPGELRRLAAEFRSSRGEAANYEDEEITVLPIGQAAALGDRENLLRFVTILVAVVAATLLIACVNVANLLMARSTERYREFAVRLALGARRTNLGRQLAVEYLLLATLGGVAAVVVGEATIRLLAQFTLPGQIALSTLDLSLDGRVLAFTAGVALCAGLVFGLLPAVRASSVSPGAALRTQGAAAHRRPLGVLVTVQVALSLILLVGATLFVRSLQAGLGTDLGFNPDGLAAVSANVRLLGYDNNREREYFAEAEERARALPGVSAAAVAAYVPLSEFPRLPFQPVGAAKDVKSIPISYNIVSPSYFNTFGIPLLEGRGLLASDDFSQPKVAVVSRSAARLLSPTEPILGRTITMLGSIAWTVVGVAADTKVRSVRDDGEPVVYAALSQMSALQGASLVVRSERSSASLPEMERILRALEPTIPLRNTRMVGDQVQAVLMPQRFGATLLGLFALVALAVSAVGIYGVVAHGVSQRRAEFGIRIALGARRGDIARAVTLRSGLAVGAGVVVGLVGAVVLTRGLEQFLVGITLRDPVTFVTALAVLGAAAAAACIGPVRRANALDPLEAIRSE